MFIHLEKYLKMNDLYNFKAQINKLNSLYTVSVLTKIKLHNKSFHNVLLHR